VGAQAVELRGGDVEDSLTDRAISRAIGEELRRRREDAGWSRAQLVALLPSGIGDRTLLSYEHGTRHLTVLRLIELCRPLDTTASALLSSALRRARIYVENLDLRINLHALVADDTAEFRPMGQWARNKLTHCPNGIVEIGPAVIGEIALFMGCDHRRLAAYLARFISDDATAEELEDSAVIL
jgi:transcriptional regulator with XRE-family HTH domain